jgi:hypothetical protein
MNKQLTKKTIGIAASAALMASLAFSGSALAGKPDKEQGPPPAQDVSCNLSATDSDGNYVVTHACADTLRSVNAAILGATTVNDRDTNSLLNKVCEAHFKFEAEKLHDSAQKLMDIKMTIESKRKVSDTDQASIAGAAEDAAYQVLASCQ